jgi:hypothetical protein
VSVVPEPTRADRDRAVDSLREGVSAGLLPLDEFEARLDAAYQVASMGELRALVAGLPTPARHKHQRFSRGEKLFAALVLAVWAIVLGVAVSSGSPPSAKSNAGSHDAAPPRPKSLQSLHPSTPATAGDLRVAVVNSAQFSRHDPSNECGAFGTKTVVGGSNCYLAVRVTNTSLSAVNFVPADLRMVDQTGERYSIAPVLPKCFDTMDVNAPATLTPNASATVQLCYPVRTGALPRVLVGTEGLDGLSVPVPPESIEGTWGGA